MSKEQAIDKLVDLDAAKWGEGERAASRRIREKHCATIGLALNSLAHYDPLNVDATIAAEARKVMTPTDWIALR